MKPKPSAFAAVAIVVLIIAVVATLVSGTHAPEINSPRAVLAK